MHLTSGMLGWYVDAVVELPVSLNIREFYCTNGRICAHYIGIFGK